MKNYKLNKTITILSSIFLASTLYGCMPNNQKKVEEQITKENQNSNEKKKDYLDTVEEEFKEIKDYAKEKWNSEEITEKREIIKQKLIELIDFIFNDKEINGITFKELKEEEKEKIIEEFNKLDNIINEYIPDYKKRFQNWLVDKSTDTKEWLVDKGADLKETWNNFKTEVEEEYNSRQLTKKM